MLFDWTAELRELVRDGYIRGFQNGSQPGYASIFHIYLLEGTTLRTECSVHGGIRVSGEGSEELAEGPTAAFESFEQLVHRFSGLAKKKFFEDLTCGFSQD